MSATERNRDAVDAWKRAALAKWDSAPRGPYPKPALRHRLDWRIYELRLRLAFWIAPDDSIEAS